MLAMIESGVPGWGYILIFVAAMAVIVAGAFMLFSRYSGKMEQGYYPAGPRDKSLWQRWHAGDPLRRSKFLQRFSSTERNE